ncbi:MAG: hypothetical protein ACI9PY_003697 [Ascidiaceihabitans sp.]|jgi:hypothetical protein
MLTTKTRSQSRITTAILSLALLGAATVSNAETTQSKIARAITAAPSDITNEATIMDVDGTILRAGTNGWVCIPGVGLIPGDTHPMCNDPVWMKWMAAMASGSAFTTDVIGVSYMMAGDPMLNVDNPMATDPNDGGVWRQEGAHVMLLFPDMDVLADLSRDPFSGGPYIMWGGTPMEHVILPIDAKNSPK